MKNIQPSLQPAENGKAMNGEVSLIDFTAEECLRICREAEIPHLVACHFNLFSFNTIDRRMLVRYLQASAPKAGIAFTVPKTGMVYDVVTS